MQPTIIEHGDMPVPATSPDMASDVSPAIAGAASNAKNASWGRPERTPALCAARLVTVIVGYFALGWIGLQLAVPPGYATPMWPAAGFALGALLVRGKRLVVGVWIGSFLINCMIGQQAADGPNLMNSVLVPATIATGIMLQTLLAAVLLHRQFGKPINLNGYADIVKFALIAGPLSCLVGCTIGVAALYLSGIATDDMLLNSFAIWWFGDVLGVLAILPVLLLSPWSDWQLNWRGRPIAKFTPMMTLALVVLIVATLAAWKLASITTYERNEQTFETLTIDNEQALRHRLQSYEQSLDAGAALLNASKRLEKGEWEAFVETIRIDEKLPGISGIGLIRPVKREDIPAWNKFLNASGEHPFMVHPLTGRKMSYVISSIAPYEHNQAAYGLDIAFEDNRRDAAEWARDSGEATITKRIHLVQDSTQTPGFLLLRPYYRPGMDTQTIEQRRDALVGWVYAPFIANRFMHKLTASQGVTVDISVYDGAEVEAESLIYSSRLEDDWSRIPKYQVEKNIQLYGQTWTVLWTSRPAFTSSVSTKEPWLILAGGLGLTFLFGVLMLFYTRKQSDIARQVEIKTRELTERERGLQQALFALGESEKRFSALAGMSPVGIFRTDAFGFCTFVNDAWLAVTGLTAQEALGAGWLGAVHPDDKEGVNKAWLESIGKQQALRMEFRFLGRDGKVKWADLISTPEKDDEDHIIGFIGVVVDNSDKRKAEQKLAERDARLAFLVDNMTDGLILMSLDGKVKDVSGSIERMLGVSREQIIGLRLGRILAPHPDDIGNSAEMYGQLVRGEIERVLTSYRVQQLNEPIGQWRWLETSARLIRDAETGAPASILISLRDIDERKQLQQQVEAALEHAQAATRAKSEFLANMSHEIRTPMNGVLGFTELLLASNIDSGQRRQLELILQSSRSMMQILNDILDLSKIEAGRMHIISEPLALRHELQHWVGSLEALAQKKNLDLKLNVDPALPRRIMGDQLRLRQIVMNLIGNALKFTDRGYVAVRAIEDRGKLVIEVEDTGIGIPEEQQSTIFEQFVQAEKSTDRKYGGTGLGLAITSQLARMMDGDVTLQSEVGTGTTITLTIPLIPVEEDEADDEDDVEHSLPTDFASSEVTLLLVEDNEINQELVTQMLNRLGYKIDLAVNGEEAITKVLDARFGNAPYPLVLMDLQMPILDGRDATRRIRALGIDAEELPIIALSANAYPEDIAECLKCGMQAHIAKPVRMRSLEETISRWLNQSVRLPVEEAMADEQQDALPKLEPEVANDDAGNEARPDAAEPSPNGSQDMAPKGVGQPQKAARPPRKSGGIAEKYAKRKADLVALIEATLADENVDNAGWDDLISALHQLAGTAGMFGEAKLGEAASRLENDLRAADADLRPALLDDAAGTIRGLSGLDDQDGLSGDERGAA